MKTQLTIITLAFSFIAGFAIAKPAPASKTAAPVAKKAEPRAELVHKCQNEFRNRYGIRDDENKGSNCTVTFAAQEKNDKKCVNGFAVGYGISCQKDPKKAATVERDYYCCGGRVQ